MTSLDVALLYLLAAVLAVVVFRLLKLPAMLGYLVAGIVLGPHALSLAGDSQRVNYLAEKDGFAGSPVEYWIAAELQIGK